jgi:hypothetical protein
VKNLAKAAERNGERLKQQSIRKERGRWRRETAQTANGGNQANSSS